MSKPRKEPTPVSKRLSPAERIRGQIDQLFSSDRGLAEVLEEVGQRGTTEAFISPLFGKGVTRTNALESLVIAGYVHGLSARDVEATLADALGEQAALSRSTVSRICSAVKDEFDVWKSRNLSRSSWSTYIWTAVTSAASRAPARSR